MPPLTRARVRLPKVDSPISKARTKTVKAKATPKPATTAPEGGQCWLVKAEPETRIEKGKDVRFSIDDLKAMPNATSPWDGVRNYEARNIMRDRMQVGDKVLFYHSNCKEPGIAGIAEIVREGYPDYTAWDSSHPYYDPKSDKDTPKWFMVDIRYIAKFRVFVSLRSLKDTIDPAFANMVLLNRGRLSVQPVTSVECEAIIRLGGLDPSYLPEGTTGSE